MLAAGKFLLGGGVGQKAKLKNLANIGFFNFLK